MKTPQEIAEQAHAGLSALPDLQMHGSESIAFLLYDGFTALDLAGPHHFMGQLMGAKVHLVTLGDPEVPVLSDIGLPIMPTASLADTPDQIDVLIIPGGAEGTVTVAQSAPLLDWVRDVATQAQWLGGVCTGGIILGAAGLLKGRKATSHWVVHDLLAQFGAVPTDARVVVDAPVITAAGVTAGIDLGVTSTSLLRGSDYAATLELMSEYDPEPPMGTGTPAKAGEPLSGLVRDMFASMNAGIVALAHQE